MHLTEEQFQRYLHDELDTGDKPGIDAHLRGCTECRAHIAEIERDETEILGLLRQLDHAPPTVPVAGLMKAAPGERAAPLRRAAMVLLATGAVGAAAYALPGSPLRDWIGALTQDGEAAPPALEVPPASADYAAGIALAPGRRLDLVFPATATGLVRIKLTDGAEVVVRTTDRNAVFNSGTEQLAVDHADPGAPFEVEIPRQAPLVRIRVLDRIAFSKTGDRITTDATADASGTYVLRLLSQTPR